jgi:hypothetical protein
MIIVPDVNQIWRNDNSGEEYFIAEMDHSYILLDTKSCCVKNHGIFLDKTKLISALEKFYFVDFVFCNNKWNCSIYVKCVVCRKILIVGPLSEIPRCHNKIMTHIDDFANETFFNNKFKFIEGVK